MFSEDYDENRPTTENTIFCFQTKTVF